MAQRLSQVAQHLQAAVTPAPAAPGLGPTVPHKHELNPTMFLPRAAIISPDAEAIAHRSATGKDVRYNYREFAKRASDLAYYLKEECFVKNGGHKTVALLASNTPMMLEAYFGVVAAAGVVAAINYRLHRDEILYIITQSRAHTIIVDREFLPLLEGCPAYLTVIIDDDDDGCSGPYGDILAKGATIDRALGGLAWAGLPVEHVPEDDTMALMFTSGTTGHPKAVEYTHRGVYLAALGNVVDSSLNSTDPFGSGGCRYLQTLPTFHAAGWTFPWSIVAVCGQTTCLRSMDYALIWQYLRNGTTNFCCAPTVCTLLLAHKDCIRLNQPVRVTVAAAPPSAALFKAMLAQNLAPIHVYGLTETYGPLMKGYLKPEWIKAEDGLRFKLMARQGYGFSTSRAARVRVLRDGSWTDVLPNGEQSGEIHVQGNIVMKGYFDNPEATAKAFTSDMYFRTGDIAVVHPDGALEIRDRAKDEINTGGEKVSSIEVEAVLVKMPEILECAVVGKPHQTWGETPVAFVTVRKQIDPSVIKKFVRSQLAGYKVPSEIFVEDSLPKTSTGKVQKNELRKRFAH